MSELVIDREIASATEAHDAFDMPLLVPIDEQGNRGAWPWAIPTRLSGTPPIVTWRVFGVGGPEFFADPTKGSLCWGAAMVHPETFEITRRYWWKHPPFHMFDGDVLTIEHHVLLELPGAKP